MLAAFSTHFHETIHWWQHIGTTTGLMLSFAYPTQFHSNLPHLRKALSDFGPRKSLKTFLTENYFEIPDEPRKRLNIIVNNWHDVEFNQRLILNPGKAQSTVNNTLFECVGHSLEMGLAHTILLLCASFDREVTFLPDPRKWETGFADLRNRKIEGYYHGSPVRLSPIGAFHIFEGQARFSQLQYLHLAHRNGLTWSYFKESGMLSSPYTDAFERFLEWAEIDRPPTVVDSVVQLFLLVCDLAVNPSDGYPFPLQHFESFVISNDPGTRFYFFSRQIARNPKLRSAIVSCSRAEYLSIAAPLCKAMVCKTPVEIASHIARWSEHQPSLRKLMEEDSTFEFTHENLPVRVCFARHVRLMRDKARRPEFFCWPAMHLVERTNSGVDLEASTKIWLEHEALFGAELGGEIRPTLLPGRNQEKIQQTFNGFYQSILLYDFVRQWTVSDGPFNYDYRWLTPKYSADITKPFVDQIFAETFNVSPDSFIGSN